MSYIFFGKYFHVLLVNRFGDKYLEKYSLSIIVVYKGQFFGGLGLYTLHWPVRVDQNEILSYAYSAFISLVCTIRFHHKLKDIFHLMHIQRRSYLQKVALIAYGIQNASRRLRAFIMRLSVGLK